MDASSGVAATSYSLLRSRLAKRKGGRTWRNDALDRLALVHQLA